MACRYAIYFSPRPQTALAAFGAAALGYDVDARCETPFHPGLDTPSRDWRALVAEPSRYGFHATLKAPFELVADTTETALLERAGEVARQARGCALGRLEVVPLNRFVALMPVEVPAGIGRLERMVVEGFEPLRAPLPAADRARRLAVPLTDRQLGYLDAWGYPYVLEEFRFHMTLAGPVPQPQITEVSARLAQLYEPFDEPARLDEITVLCQTARDRRFQVLARLALCG